MKKNIRVQDLLERTKQMFYESCFESKKTAKKKKKVKCVFHICFSKTIFFFFLSPKMHKKKGGLKILLRSFERNSETINSCARRPKD